jgi:FkbM family methyltransferase
VRTRLTRLASYDPQVPSDHPFISFGENAEDVVLHRALGEVTDGRYVEVGAHRPTQSSVTRAFYDRGWSGVAVEPVAEFVETFRRLRPRDAVVQAAVTDADVQSVTIHVIEGTGLSTLDEDIAEGHRSSGRATTEETVPARRLDAVLDEQLRQGDDIHFMVVDTAGSERAALAGVDLRRWRPWVLVVGATAPNSSQQTHQQWEHLVLEAGYEFCLFDGVSRFYVAAEHADRLQPTLSYPANVRDDFVPHHWNELDQELTAARDELARLRSAHDDVLEELVSWRGDVLARWTDAVGASAGSTAGSTGRGTHEVVRLKEELAAMRATVSWRITAPLRAVQQQRLREWR